MRDRVYMIRVGIQNSEHKIPDSATMQSVTGIEEDIMITFVLQGPASSIPNGIIGQQGVKSMTSLNHVGSAAVTEALVSHDDSSSPLVQVAPLSDTTLNTLEHHTTTPPKLSKSESYQIQ